MEASQTETLAANGHLRAIPLERPLHRPCREANILWLYREWFLSVCLDYGPMGEALPPHAPANVVGFDLLDDFAVVNGIIETPGELADATAMQTHIDRLKRERDATKDKDEKRRIKSEIIGFYGSATTNDQTPCKFGRTGWLRVPAT